MMSDAVTLNGDAEKRLTEVESKLMYAEAEVAELNDVVIELRNSLAILTNHVNKLEKKVEDLISEAGDGERPNRKPPHY